MPSQELYLIHPPADLLRPGVVELSVIGQDMIADYGSRTKEIERYYDTRLRRQMIRRVPPTSI